MDASYAAQAPFYYYNQDPRINGHFSSHPQQNQYQGAVMYYPEHMVPFQQGFPQHATIHNPTGTSQYPAQYQQMPQGMPRAMITPVASPQPFQPQQRATVYMGKPAMQLFSIDTECGPSTPPLSISGSAVNSPPSAYLPTPIGGVPVMRQLSNGIRQTCEGEFFGEHLPVVKRESRPLTPGKLTPLILIDSLLVE